MWNAIENANFKYLLGQPAMDAIDADIDDKYYPKPERRLKVSAAGKIILERTWAAGRRIAAGVGLFTLASFASKYGLPNPVELAMNTLAAVSLGGGAITEVSGVVGSMMVIGRISRRRNRN